MTGAAVLAQQAARREKAGAPAARGATQQAGKGESGCARPPKPATTELVDKKLAPG